MGVLWYQHYRDLGDDNAGVKKWPASAIACCSCVDSSENCTLTNPSPLLCSLLDVQRSWRANAKRKLMRVVLCSIFV